MPNLPQGGSSLADHQTRQARAMAMAERCSAMGNHDAAQEWLSVAVSQGNIVASMQASMARHPAFNRPTQQ